MKRPYLIDIGRWLTKLVSGRPAPIRDDCRLLALIHLESGQSSFPFINSQVTIMVSIRGSVESFIQTPV